MESELQITSTNCKPSIHSLPGVAVVSTDHRFLWVDEVFADLVGYRPDELVGRRFEDITHREDVELDAQLANRLIDGEISEYEMEKRYLRRTGAVVPIHLTARVIRDRNGNVLYGLACVEKRSVPEPSNTDVPVARRNETDADKIRRAILD